jgi:hypothetical protein
MTTQGHHHHPQLGLPPAYPAHIIVKKKVTRSVSSGMYTNKINQDIQT